VTAEALSGGRTMTMKTQDFDYVLPPELIAQYPLESRDKCRLLCLGRRTGAVSDRIFKDLPDLVWPGDLLVFNDTRVLPARIFCHKKTGGAAELLLTDPLGNGQWKALVRPGRGMIPGAVLALDKDPAVSIEIVSVLDDGTRIVAIASQSTDSLEAVIHRHGVMALPHYIKRSAETVDNETYQTIYARREGAVASPTAGLHFTKALMEDLGARGVETAFVTLHVGIGTFRPVKVDDPEKHHMHRERYEVNQETADRIEETKKAGGRVIAVGTTVVRVLEHCAAADETGLLKPSSGDTDIFILPGYQFRVIDGVITNFHVPRSTLLMLVSAFAGRDAVLAAYRHAVEKKYRFFSYGDAMLIA
jgi:S-adenosylmethionine:tRNA ribosyltransferase-isomerase